MRQISQKSYLSSYQFMIITLSFFSSLCSWLLADRKRLFIGSEVVKLCLCQTLKTGQLVLLIISLLLMVLSKECHFMTQRNIFQQAITIQMKHGNIRKKSSGHTQQMFHILLKIFFVLFFWGEKKLKNNET